MIRREILDDVDTRVRHVTNADHCRRWLGLDELLDVIEIAPNDEIKGVPPVLADSGKHRLPGVCTLRSLLFVPAKDFTVNFGPEFNAKITKHLVT